MGVENPLHFQVASRGFGQIVREKEFPSTYETPEDSEKKKGKENWNDGRME